MSFWRIFLYVLFAVFVWAFAFVMALINTFGRIEYDYEFHDFKFDFLALVNELATKKEVVLDAFLKLTLKNPTWLSITIKQPELTLYYEGVLFAVIMKEGTENFQLIKRTETVFDKRINVYVNRTTFEIVNQYFSKQPMKFDFTFKGKLFGMTLTQNGSYTYVPE